MNYVDCSHPLEPGPATYPGDPAIAIEPHATHAEDGFRVTHLSLGSHAGTHVDAPGHLLADGRTLDEFPVETFAFDAVRVQVPDLDPRQPITRADLPNGLADDSDRPTDVSDRLADDFGPSNADSDLREIDLVAFHTGWDAHWGSSEYLDHPYLAPDFARWLADRECHVGIDAVSVDPTPTDRASPDEPEGFPTHRALLGADRLVVENLTGLASIPERFTLLAFPLAVPDADGAPVRAVAHVEG